MTPDQPTTEKPLRQLTAQEFIDIITEVNREKYEEFYQVGDFGVRRIIIKDVDVTEGVIVTDDVTVNLPLQGFLIKTARSS